MEPALAASPYIWGVTKQQSHNGWEYCPHGFFHPRQFHLEAPNLFKEFSFTGGLGLLVTGPLLAEQGAPLLPYKGM